jgi:hypothetical protein
MGGDQLDYRVTVGFVTVETTVGAGRASVDIQCGDLLPRDVPQEQVDRLLDRGDITVAAPPPDSAEPKSARKSAPKKP